MLDGKLIDLMQNDIVALRDNQCEVVSDDVVEGLRLLALSVYLDDFATPEEQKKIDEIFNAKPELEFIRKAAATSIN